MNYHGCWIFGVQFGSDMFLMLPVPDESNNWDMKHKLDAMSQIASFKQWGGLLPWYQISTDSPGIPYRELLDLSGLSRHYAL